MGKDLVTRLAALQGALRETPVVPLDLEDGIKLFAKLECNNPVGSLKDRPALWILNRAAERRDIDERTTLIESSSGNFASAVAFYAQQISLKFIPVVDPNINDTYERFLRQLCEEVVKVTERDETGGFLKTRLEKVKELCASIERSYWTNQYGNPDAVEAHYRFTAGEICSQFSSLDYVFVGVSTGATIAGVSRRLKEKFPRLQVIAVDAQGSVIFGDAPRKRRISGLGASVRSDLVNQALIDDVVIIPEIETVHGCRELFARHGLLVGGSSGSCYAAIKRYLPRLRSSSPPTVLFLCADRGVAYADTLFNDAWVTRSLDH